MYTQYNIINPLYNIFFFGKTNKPTTTFNLSGHREKKNLHKEENIFFFFSSLPFIKAIYLVRKTEGTKTKKK